MHLEELDIDAMRAAILNDMYEAMKPFQAELQKLEILEGLVDRTAAAKVARSSPKPNGHIQAHERLVEKAKRAKRSDQYAGRGQAKSCLQILKSEPGLSTAELVDRLRAGGYVFASVNPPMSLGTALRKLVLKGVLRTEATSDHGTPLKYYVEGA